MEEFLKVPSKLEGLLFFGCAICFDSFLNVLTVLPLKFVWSCLCFICTILRPGKGIGKCRFHRRYVRKYLFVFQLAALHNAVSFPPYFITLKFSFSFLHYVLYVNGALHLHIDRNPHIYTDICINLYGFSSSSQYIIIVYVRFLWGKCTIGLEDKPC